jgi:hypothetical protein
MYFRRKEMFAPNLMKTSRAQSCVSILKADVSETAPVPIFRILYR